MTPIQWFAAGALASASFAAIANPAPAPANPLDTSAAVPAPTYESAFNTYRPATTEGQPSADKAWRAANDELSKPGAHGHGGHAMPAAAPPPATPKTAPPMDHSKHH
jgi:hypothetical protein